jgi:hypothetical protein
MKTRGLKLLWFLHSLPLCIFSQLKINGKIVNMQNKPVESAEIILLKDKKAVKSELSNSKGLFSLEAQSGTYLLEIRQIGILYTKEIELSNDLELGTITVDLTKIQKGVTVNAKKKLIEKKIDRLVFNVENSIAAIGGDALDALRVAPGLSVQNDQITMIGRSSMNVMLNDRMINLSGDDLINFLKSLKTSDIKKIEIITNPPAKYDAQGNSGLINIVTKTAKSNSYNGSIRGSVSQAQKSIGTIGTSFNYQKNKTTLVSSINYSNGSLEPYQKYTLQYPTYLWKENNNKRNYLNNWSGRLGLDYKVSKNARIGLEYAITDNLPLIKAENNSFIFNTMGLDSFIKNRARLDMKRLTNAYTLYAVINLDTMGKKLNIDVDYLNYQSRTENTFFSNAYFANGNIKPDQYFSAENLSNLDIDITTARLDFEFPTKKVQLNFGTKLSFIRNQSNVAFYNTTTGMAIIDPLQTNKFNYNENIQAAYISGFTKLTKKLEMQVGFRGETTQAKGIQTATNSKTINNYFKLFPTLYLNYPITKSQNISFNYGKRINRPTYNNLNPFRFYSTSFNYAEGNPFLQPYITHNFELSHLYKNYYTMLYINYLSNAYDQVTIVQPNTIIQKVRPENFYNQMNIGIYQGYSYRYKNIWENNSTLTLFHSKSKSTIQNIIPNVSAWSGSLNTTNTFTVDKKKIFKAEVGFTYQTPSLAGSYKLSSYYQINLGFKGSIWKNKLQFAVNGFDVFKTNKQTFTQIVNGIRQENFDYADIRRVRISLTYNFGKTFKLNKKNEVNKDEKQRIN